MNLVSLDYI